MEQIVKALTINFNKARSGTFKITVPEDASCMFSKKKKITPISYIHF